MELGDSVLERITQKKFSELLASIVRGAHPELGVPVFDFADLWPLFTWKHVSRDNAFAASAVQLGWHADTSYEFEDFDPAAKIGADVFTVGYSLLRDHSQAQSPYCPDAEGAFPDKGWNGLAYQNLIPSQERLVTRLLLKGTHGFSEYTHEHPVLIKQNKLSATPSVPSGITQIRGGFYITSPVILGCYTFPATGQLHLLYDMFDRSDRSPDDRPAGPVLLVRNAMNLARLTREQIGSALLPQTDVTPDDMQSDVHPDTHNNTSSVITCYSDRDEESTAPRS
ncbi:MAG: hypothetical protein TR69_WS6001000061 [candidate division WS6 bacterium OLB20]|uniref:Uncharacterized protein n=1 Tax=candidate division WS6 bacterium OLB20 TaxID=1617426 RepID=A0A136M164_9BACT|nr:MAG: hypothetical protein TR69_WS6001000061 [candidate division WS6 bacterium OLB20]